MAITVTCKCGKSHQVKDQFAGHETNCPYCGKPLTIPNIEKPKEILTSPPSVVESRSLEKEEMVKPPVFQDIQPETLSSAEEEQAAVPTRPEPQRPVEPGALEQQQAKFRGSEDKEICTNCGRQMPGSEQACVLNGNIVCAECDKKLRGEVKYESAEMIRPKAAEAKKEKPIPIEGKLPKKAYSSWKLYVLGAVLLVLGLLTLPFLAGIPLLILAAICFKRGRRLAWTTAHTKKAALQASLCFFCQVTEAQEGTACSVPMFKIIETKKRWGGIVNRMDGTLLAISPGKTVYYHSGTEKVPRCGRCKAWHELGKKYKNRSFGIVAISGAVIGLLIIIVGDLGLGLIVAVLGCFVGALVAPVFADILGKRPHGAKVISYQKESPAIKQLTAQGWKLGEKPDAYAYDRGTIQQLSQRKRDIELMYVLSRVGYGLLVFSFIVLLLIRKAMGDQTPALYYLVTGLIGIFGILGGVAGLILTFSKDK